MSTRVKLMRTALAPVTKGEAFCVGSYLFTISVPAHEATILRLSATPISRPFRSHFLLPLLHLKLNSHHGGRGTSPPHEDGLTVMKDDSAIPWLE